jgi:hypothetical protein
VQRSIGAVFGSQDHRWLLTGTREPRNLPAHGLDQSGNTAAKPTPNPDLGALQELTEVHNRRGQSIRGLQEGTHRPGRPVGETSVENGRVE